MKFNPEHHHRRSIRLKGFDYSSPGFYFLTICTYDKECYLGEIRSNKMYLNEVGRAVQFTWEELPNHNSIKLESFIIMPNHIHGVIQIVGAGSKPAQKENLRYKIPEKRADLDSAPTRKSSLPEIVRQFKTFSVRRICSAQKLWQRNYYEHIIRNNKELICIRKYIETNPATWDNDEYNIV